MTKLIFCFDGTSNDPNDSGDFFSDGSISNVLKLHAIFGGKLNPNNGANEKMPGQHSFYYSGIGTYGGVIKQALNAMFASPEGDMSDIIENANKDLDENFKDGDEIYIFGFSRGAAIARMFSSKVNKPIKFLGVFDTVAATKGSLDLKKSTYPASGIVFENGTIGKHIESAVHLVALDEKRIIFQPTLFNKDERVTEVWLAGAHSDIGGSFWFDGLSDIALKFMCEKAKESGLEILDPKDIEYSHLNDNDSNEYDGICHDDIAIHPLYKGKIHEQNRPSMIANKTLAPRFVRVNVDDKKSNEHLPIIHHTVRDRFNEVTGYRPYALRNAKYRIMKEDGSIGGELQGVNGLRD